MINVKERILTPDDEAYEVYQDLITYYPELELFEDWLADALYRLLLLNHAQSVRLMIDVGLNWDDAIVDVF